MFVLRFVKGERLVDNLLSREVPAKKKGSFAEPL